MKVEDLIFYQIYPRSFCDGNGDGEGDIRGVLSKVEYLKTLGVNAVWFSPCFESPNKDNGYDIADYRNISPKFGTFAEFENLLRIFHENGIKVVLDFVANHTSTEHEWFQKARESKDNPYRDYYIWRKTPPNDWQSLFGGSAWQYDEKTKEYYLHSFAVEQADLNWENPKVREEMKAIVDFWVDKGVDGFRCDVLDMISKDFEADKNGNGPKLHEYIREIFGRQETENIFTVGECWGTTPENVRLFCAPERRELTTVFNFHHLCVENGRFNAGKPDLREVLQRLSYWQELTQKLGLTATVFLGNHDQPRSVSRFGDEKTYRYESATALGGMVLLHCGVPFIYQGEEIGMINSAHTQISQFRDIESLNYYQANIDKIATEELIKNINANGRDNARQMLPWNEQAVKSWQGDYAHRTQINVEKDLASKRSVFQFYKKLIALRKKYSCFTKGEYRLVELNENYYEFERRYTGERISVLFNFGKRSVHPDKIKGEILLNNYETVAENLQPYQLIVYKNASR